MVAAAEVSASMTPLAKCAAVAKRLVEVALVAEPFVTLKLVNV